MLRCLLIPLTVLTALALPAPGRAEDPKFRAIEVTRGLLDDAHQAMSGDDNPAALRRAISSAFDFDLWERYLIGDRAAAFTPAQRDEFRGLLPGFMAYLYRRQFDRGLTGAPSVGSARNVRRDVMVRSRFRRANGGDLPVEWRLRETPGRGARVIDMMVGGTSFLMLKREEFHTIIDRDGAEGMLRYMRENSM